jgi:NUDIX domain
VPAAAMVIVLNGTDRVLMMWRHRFVIDRWVWELPGGYLDPDEDPAVCAGPTIAPRLSIMRSKPSPIRGGWDVVGQ